MRPLPDLGRLELDEFGPAQQVFNYPVQFPKIYRLGQLIAPNPHQVVARLNSGVSHPDGLAQHPFEPVTGVSLAQPFAGGKAAPGNFQPVWGCYQNQ